MNDEPIGKLIAYAQALGPREGSALEVAALLALLAVGLWIGVRMYRGH